MISLSREMKQYSTPYYLYDTVLLKKTLQHLQKASKKHKYTVHYALKANSNIPILELIRSYGLGADCVSGNEIQRAIDTGFTSDSIVFAGVGKNDQEIALAIDKKIFCFNIESKQEIEIINQIANRKGCVAPISIRINPDVYANTHKYITTGIEENKFGVGMWEVPKILHSIKKSTNIELIGLHFHIGSQIRELEPFKHLCLKVNDIQQYFRNHNIYLKHINLGGGLGVNYEDPDGESITDFESFFDLFNDFLILYPEQKVHFELGRAIVAHCANIISRVLYIKKGVNTNFAIIDAGMTELIRPALYQAYHKIELISGEKRDKKCYYDVVGPICESSDCFGKRVNLPELKRGDLLAIRSTGAYGEVMGSNYNLRPSAEAYYL